MNAKIQAKPWVGGSPPTKILVMRFHALGDTVILLPYLQSLKRQFPKCELHFLTRQEVSPIPTHIRIFDRVLLLKGKRNAKIQFLSALLKLPFLSMAKYDAVLDLQNNLISRMIRKFLRPAGWAEFDRFSPLAAGERIRQTIEAVWRWKIFLDGHFHHQKNGSHRRLLQINGYQEGHALVVLNPAGYCASRNWPLANYVAFANQWREKVNSMTQFVLLLMSQHEEKSHYLKTALGDYCIDLTGQANQVEAFQIIREATLMLSEDSGLMHMAWVQQVPTIALFSSSRKDWSAPQGRWSVCLDSSDMPCGPCDLKVCQFNDNRCLTRYSPDQVLEYARELLIVKSK